MTFPTLIFTSLVIVVLCVMGIAMGDEKLISIASPATWELFGMALFIGYPIFVIVSLYRIFTTEATPDSPRLPDVGQGIKRLLFPVPPVARRQHTTRAARTTAAKPERII